MKKLSIGMLMLLPTIALCNTEQDLSYNITDIFEILLVVSSVFLPLITIIICVSILYFLLELGSRTPIGRKTTNIMHIIFGVITLGLIFIFRKK